MPPTDRPNVRSGSSRALPRGLLIAALALLVARVAFGIYESAHPAAVTEHVQWQPIAGAEAAAQASGKPILYDFTADWCGPCQRMKSEVFAHDRSAATIQSMFVPVRVLDRNREEGRNPPEVEALERRYRIDSFPTLVVVPARGGPPVILTGYQGRNETVRKLVRAAMKARTGL